MANITTVTTTGLAGEEWEDADFDILDDHLLHAPSDAESDREDEDMDWDTEMDLGKTGGAKAKAVVTGIVARKGPSTMITIRPPIQQVDTIDDEDEDDEGVSTIKVTALPKQLMRAPPASTPSIDEDIESAFALPSDLTTLALAPYSLNHRSSKNSLEWGDSQTSSSHSSDAYSTLGLADAPSSSSNSTTSASLPGSECEDEDEDSELDGLIIPAVFESGQSGKQLNKMLALKKNLQAKDEITKNASPDPEDDFEVGLIIDDEADLSASKLMVKAQQPRAFSRSKSAPSARAHTSTRPPSRMKSDRTKSPTHPPATSLSRPSYQRLQLSPSPPPKPARSQSAKEIFTPAGPSSFLAPKTAISPKPGSLRGQKSYSGLKPPTPPVTQMKLSRKASLSSLMEANQAQAPPITPLAGLSNTKLPRYEIPTAASRAKSHTSSTSRIHGLGEISQPARPTTPSSNPMALRLTMPSSMRIKSRPALSSVFPSASPAVATNPSSARAPSPLPPFPRAPSRPPSSMSLRARSRQGLSAPHPLHRPAAPRVLRRPKRQRTYGDGTELDGIDDLPTDRDKEGQFRVVPKGYGNRVPGGSYPLKAVGDKGTIRKKRKDDSFESAETPLTTATNTIKHTGRIEFPSIKPTDGSSKKKKRDVYSPTSSTTRRKPTLIRHLGGAAAPKVVGEMKWNPTSLRWEGNDQVLREFDAVVGTSIRPALITQLTGSSMGSPVGSVASGSRKVGNMIFDPSRMCWISTLTPEEDEPDVFADMADDDEDWEARGGTIRASQQHCGATSDTSSTAVDTNPAPSRTRTHSESESDRGSRASIVYDVDDSFLENCRLAEERHRSEMKGWKFQLPDSIHQSDRSNLYEIRALATRKY